MNDLISVLMPVYNVAPFVSEAIESVLHQTYGNFEFVIVDDSSTDDTLKICKEYAKKDARIVLIHNEENLKIEGALNKGLQYCHGKFVVRVDGDDAVLPDRFERMKRFLDEHKDFVLIGTSVQLIDADGTFLGKSVYLSDWSLILKTCTFHTPVTHFWMTYKSIYDELQGYRKFAGSEDYDFLLRLISKGYKCTNISDYYGYKFRISRSGNSNAAFGLRKQKSAQYTAKLYRQRQKRGSDSYSYENCLRFVKVSPLSEKLFSLSSRFLYKAVVYRGEKKWLPVILYSLLSLLSFQQIRYLFNSMRYKAFVRGAL